MSDDLLDATDVPCCQIQHRWRLITVHCSGQLRELCVSRFWNSVSADRRTRPQGHPPSQLAVGGMRYCTVLCVGSARLVRRNTTVHVEHLHLSRDATPASQPADSRRHCEDVSYVIIVFSAETIRIPRCGAAGRI